MTEVVNPRRQQQQSSSSSDSPSRERPRPPALKTSHSALRSIDRPPNVRRISNRVSIAEPEPKSEREIHEVKADTSVPAKSACTDDDTKPPPNLAATINPIAHTASTLKIAFYEKLVHPFSSTSSPSPPSASSPSTSNSPSTPPSPAVEELRQSKGRLYTHYHRFQVSPLTFSPFSSLPFRRRRHNNNNNHLHEIEQATERWLSAHNGEQRLLLKKYAELLVRKRRARSATTRWETFALGVRYF